MSQPILPFGERSTWNNPAIPPAWTRTRRGGAETSREAAESTDIRASWRAFLEVLADATRPHIVEAIQGEIGRRGGTWKPSRIQTAASELERRGLIVCTDSDGRTSSNRRAQRYEITDAGRAVLAGTEAAR